MSGGLYDLAVIVICVFFISVVVEGPTQTILAFFRLWDFLLFWFTIGVKEAACCPKKPFVQAESP